MMIAIDAGNTRIKWGVHDGAGWLAQGALPTGEVAQLAGIRIAWPAGARVVACNVAGEAVRCAITAALAPRFPSVSWLRSRAGEVLN